MLHDYNYYIMCVFQVKKMKEFTRWADTYCKLSSALTYITFTLIRFLADWLIYPNSIFWSVWEKIMLVVIFFVANWYMIAAAYFSYYTKGAYGHGTLGNLLFCFTYFCEALFVFDIFVSMKKANFVHMHHGKHLFTSRLFVTYWFLLHFMDKGINITQKDIRSSYIQSITFWLDIIAVMPFEIFAPSFSSPWEVVLILKLNRLFKLWKVRNT